MGIRSAGAQLSAVGLKFYLPSEALAEDGLSPDKGEGRIVLVNKESFKLMAEDQGFSGGMQDVSDMKIKCAACGKDITELPFRPKEGQEVHCTDCFRKKKDEEREARMIDVSGKGIKCASCGKEIEKLPFEPSGDRPVYCSDCYRK